MERTTKTDRDVVSTAVLVEMPLLPPARLLRLLLARLLRLLLARLLRLLLLLARRLLRFQRRALLLLLLRPKSLRVLVATMAEDITDSASGAPRRR